VISPRHALGGIQPVVRLKIPPQLTVPGAPRPFGPGCTFNHVTRPPGSRRRGRKSTSFDSGRPNLPPAPFHDAGRNVAGVVLPSAPRLPASAPAAPFEAPRAAASAGRQVVARRRVQRAAARPELGVGHRRLQGLGHEPAVGLAHVHAGLARPLLGSRWRSRCPSCRAREDLVAEIRVEVCPLTASTGARPSVLTPYSHCRPLEASGVEWTPPAGGAPPAFRRP